jgi:hypothetical protein
VNKSEVPTADNLFYHKGIMTGVLDYHYSYELKRGDIRCTGPAHGKGLIDFFTAIDPGVCQIVTYVDDKPLDRYFFEGGEWKDQNSLTE